MPPSVSGCSRPRPSRSADISCCATSMPTPGASRPNSCIGRGLRFRYNQRSTLGSIDPQVFDRDVAVHLDGEVGAAKALRHDTGDDGGMTVDANLPADDRRIAAKMLHPERMAEDDGRRRSGTPGKERAELRVDADGRKVVVAHRDVEELRRLAFSRQAAEARHHAEDV